mmetsp:Transcript_118894/g.236910  ORF Transcript_118894/g.236910 Transcript_118894/m.236910 type:complete len:431 (+) Transcript_118894:52-1344(+)|eukprot:CAMPEP_0172727418 /NCGR_PEP_ID=MMETSP1074-20121228/91667_1 /TAXON_ID=2916 /ORGANISM="Ceratium fusus, Strain PA161109" /LENGTH=430 /DNA_ID=CAMNT_0013554565 /DNA_START=42 /DNA_END=1334 /DNA_ORIENTATION=+
MARLLTSVSLLILASAGKGPCDIFDADETPCVAAHSTVRALYGDYNGRLYQVMRSSDQGTFDIPTLTTGGFADSAAQDVFCAGTDCTINRIYDQSPRGNHLDTAPPGGAHQQADSGVNASAEKIMVGGHPVYAARFVPGNGYRNDKTSGIAVGDEAETMYMVTSGRYFNDQCCFDYGNAETNNYDDGPGTMEAVYFGNAKGGLNHGGAGKGPWIMADMEDALWGADVVNSNENPIVHDFVTAMVKGDVSLPTGSAPYQRGIDYGGNDVAPCNEGGCVLLAKNTHLDCEGLCNATADCWGYVFADASCSGEPGPICWTKGGLGMPVERSCRNSRMTKGYQPGHWAIKGGNAQAGELNVYWDGKRAPGYAPMKKQGAIILGIGGDNSAGARGSFYEGVMTHGYSSDAADAAVQANIVAAGYQDLPAINPLLV